MSEHAATAAPAEAQVRPAGAHQYRSSEREAPGNTQQERPAKTNVPCLSRSQNAAFLITIAVLQLVWVAALIYAAARTSSLIAGLF